MTANSVIVPRDFIPLAPQPSLQAVVGSPGTLAEHPGHQTSSKHGPQALLSPCVLLPLLSPDFGQEAAAFPVAGSHQRPRSRLQVGAAEWGFWNNRISDAFEEVVPLMELLFQVCMGQRW